jgi:hypothetical protein
MASFAKIGLNGKVIEVLSVNNEVLLDSKSGGVHKLGGTPFRKNHAGIGYTYDEDRDAFIPKKPFNSWVLNETTCLWESPVAYPNDGNEYYWNENKFNWELI